MMMSFLSYKVLRGTCLRFPEQLQVVVAGDVLQQWLPACSVALAMILPVEGRRQGNKRCTRRCTQRKAQTAIKDLTHLQYASPSAPY